MVVPIGGGLIAGVATVVKGSPVTDACVIGVQAEGASTDTGIQLLTSQRGVKNLIATSVDVEQ